MAIDCEFNQPSRKCIQIGAAIFDVRSGSIVATFETYVNLQEPIAPHITELTGITDRDVENAPLIAQAFNDLKLFFEQHKPFMNPLVWGSGIRNDSQAIYQEAIPSLDRENCPNFMGFRVLDVKTIYQSIKMFNNNTIKGGLSTACQKLGIPFEGIQHTALADAINTFRVWHFLVKRFNNEV
jgi:inhibitor of KinA sporulation pathway (predicted exonuclease)